MFFQNNQKNLQELHSLLQQQVAAGINMDTASYCKIMKDNRQEREEPAQQLVLSYGISYEKLSCYWLAGKVHRFIEEEEDANGILHIAV